MLPLPRTTLLLRLPDRKWSPNAASVSLASALCKVFLQLLPMLPLPSSLLSPDLGCVSHCPLAQRGCPLGVGDWPRLSWELEKWQLSPAKSFPGCGWNFPQPDPPPKAVFVSEYITSAAKGEHFSTPPFFLMLSGGMGIRAGQRARFRVWG